jgi:hypothetical protein
MITLLGLLAAYFTLFSAGFGITLLIFRGAPRINILECCCLSWLFGAGAVSIALWICGILLSGFALQITVAALCILLAALGWRAIRHPRSKFTLPTPSGWLEWFLAGLLVVEIALVLFVSCKHTLGWDGLLVWEIKARYAFLNGGVIPAGYYSNPGRAFSHPEYPLGIPFTELWLYLWIGQPHQFWVKTIFGTYYAAGAVLLCLLGARVSGRRWSGLAVATILLFVPFLTSAPGGVIVGYADFPLSVVYLAALGYLLLFSANGDSQTLIIYAFCLALLPWIKREGLILWSVLAFLGFIVSWRRGKLARFGISSLPGLFLIAGWRAYLSFVHCVPSSDFSLSVSGKLTELAARIGPIARLLFLEVSNQTDWGIFWVAAALALIYLAVRFRAMQSWILLSAVIAPIVLYCATYLFTTWSNYSAHVTSSLPRLLLQIVLASLLAIAAVLPLRSGQAQGEEWPVSC